MKQAKKIGLIMLLLVMSAGMVFAGGQAGTEPAGGGGRQRRSCRSRHPR
jgi:hypothetical protein